MISTAFWSEPSTEMDPALLQCAAEYLGATESYWTHDLRAGLRLFLARHGEDAILPILQQIRQSNHPEIQEEAVSTLFLIGRVDILEMILPTQACQNEWARVAVLEALDRLGCDVQILIPYLKDTSSMVRDSVVWSLGNREDPDAFDALKKRLRFETHPVVLESLERTISEFEEIL